ncbi:MAG: hypothetical protein A2132_06195 [Nitrospirae bacterium RBG_16_43_11]|nr:MAG: hypothetical protein A2132_06195 [Nitrospirae bacterium RBG_16_43_11]
MNISEVFDAAIDIEKRLSNLYYKLSNLFRDNSEVYNFWIKIADHEKSHCETLTLSKGCQSWDHSSAKKKNRTSVDVTDISALQLLNAMIKDFERILKKEMVSLQDALDMLLKIENSEINHIYDRLVRIYGFQFQQKPEESHRSVYEHMKIIKAFAKKYYRGNIPQIQVESAPSDISSKAGKITEITPDMSYGFIEGGDGERYMFLPEDISAGTWDNAEVNKSVQFSVVNLPWGARAKDIKIS